MPEEQPIVIAIDGTSASGKSTNSKIIARKLGFAYVDTGAMYRTLAWYCLRKKVDIHDAKAVGSAVRRWKTQLKLIDGHVQLHVDGYFPEKEIRTAETSAAVPHVAAVPKVRDWMKKTQRDCIQFGSLVMEGSRHRDERLPGNRFQILPRCQHRGAFAPSGGRGSGRGSSRARQT